MEVLFFMVSEAQKRANKKQDGYRIQFSVNYRLHDLNEGQSANSYLKELIKKDLDSKGV